MADHPALITDLGNPLRTAASSITFVALSWL
ncbi:Uncharacterised protein [Segatella copri]|nr:Uncharacterised protein [Segatella copri]